MEDVRVRFAPSPTGFLHIGGARTALFNWLYARHSGGTFVLRIEDTDAGRDTQEAVDVIFSGLRWLGLDWDEGPFAREKFGPYFQSKRGEIYKKYLAKLRSSGLVYDKDGAIYFKISGKPQVINDLIRGTVTRKEEKDFVIFRSDGSPVFHFVNVVDDIDMQITHVIRGEDHLSNTSKHVELFKAFDAKIPHFAHISLILKEHGQGKMSKRDTGALVEDYEKRKFLPAALRNYLCLLGWAPGNDTEVLPIEEIIKMFELKDVNKTNARFDEKKLAHINSEYLRSMPMDEFCDLGFRILLDQGIITQATDREYVFDILSICQEKVRSFEELTNFVSYFFSEDYEFDDVAKEKLAKFDPVKRINEVINGIMDMTEYYQEKLEELIVSLANFHHVKTGYYIHTVRFAISGRSVGPSFYRLLSVLGKKNVLSRLKKALNVFR
ncbi:MAG: glutamate--tRNA ligase [Puniceicoccales bacterium]|jgi:glutamyl-tRNA synthetase|nr:glutamate--tRNA ligase [Puniceicoccales bacterium]